MNIQTEQLENHTARLTVEIANDRLEDAKKKAAKKIARQVNIPGFRRGKAPYHVLVQAGLEPQILNEAIDELSQDIYRESLEHAEVDPYGPGSFEDFNLEETPTFVYTVPLQPTVELSDYRSVRVDYEDPEVTEDELERAMKRLQQQQAEVEESEGPVEVGNRVTLDIHSTFADDPAEATAEETADAAEAEEGEEAEADNVPKKGDNFIHEHNARVDLDPDAEPVLPGFIDEVVGANVDDELDFELTVPADYPEYEDIAGRKIQFNVVVQKVETVKLPELDDELAAKITEEEEDGPLTLEQLQERVHENLYNQKLERYREQYVTRVLDEIVGMSEFKFPEMMIEEQIDGMLQDFDQRLRQQGMSLETFRTLTGRTDEEIRADYRDPAIQSIQRTLTMRELVVEEQLDVTDAEIDGRIDEMMAQFGEQAAQIRGMFDTPQMRSNLANELLQQAVLDRIIAIARGEEVPEPGSAPAPAAEVETATEAEEAEEATDAAEDSPAAEVEPEADAVEADANTDEAAPDEEGKTAD
ncbi:MAG: trigger factor [Chloroflexota bacterium]